MHRKLSLQAAKVVNRAAKQLTHRAEKPGEASTNNYIVATVHAIL